MFKFFRDMLDKEAERPRLAYCAPILLFLFMTFGDQYLGEIYYSHNPSIQKPHEQLKDQLTAMYQELELMPNTEFIDVTSTMRSHDVTLIGAKISAAAVSVTAARDIHLNSAQNKQQVNNSLASTAWAIGTNIASSQNNQQEHGSVLTNTVSLINADSAVQLNAGHDVNMIGAKVSSGKVAVRAGHDLNLVSLQDIDSYNADSSSAGFDRNIDKAVNADDLLLRSSNKGKTKANYNSVTNQTGIFAGEGGFAIFVGGNTQLQGSVIASDAPDDVNRLSTDTLSFSDIDNVAEYVSSGHGITYASQSEEKGSEIEKGFTPSLLPTIKDEAGSTTKAAISVGNDRIEVRSNPDIDLAAICTDTKEALNVLPKIFDKQAVQEKQELTNLFGQMAFEAVGELARSYQAKAYDKFVEAARTNDPEKKAGLIKEANDILSEWGQGGTNKIALHALVGGIMADLAGHGFAAGAVAAGLNEALQKELGEWEEQNRAANQWVSLAIGAALDQAAGSGSNIGAAAALSGTKYNWDHTAHNYIIRKLGHDKYTTDELIIANHTYDTDHQDDCHAMPMDVEIDYYRTQARIDPYFLRVSDVSRFATPEDYYRHDQEKTRTSIVEKCKKRIENAIDNKNKNKSLEAIWELAIALHIVADDYSHRQGNNGWGQHLPPNLEHISIEANKRYGYFTYKGEEVPIDEHRPFKMGDLYNVARCDNMFNPINKDKFDKAIKAAEAVNRMYNEGVIKEAEIDMLFPKLYPMGILIESGINLPLYKPFGPTG